MSKLPWLDDVDDDHYAAAEDYLSLLMNPATAASAIGNLRDQKIVKHLPGDLLRAACLPILPLDDEGVKREIRKALKNRGFQPLLYLQRAGDLICADGYHRTCAAYHLAPFRPVLLKLA